MISLNRSHESSRRATRRIMVHPTVLRSKGLIGVFGACISSLLSGCMSPPAWVSHPTADDLPEARPVSTHINDSASENWTVLRVGGDMEARVTGGDGDWRFARSRVDTPLPVGYPPPTPPGSIELKKYPPVRRAQYSGEINPNLGMNLGFFPLFRHISRKEIAMTSPVEMEYHGWDDAQSSPDSWTMAFLYREPDLGTLGKDGNVIVADVEPITVLSVGLNGAYTTGTVQRGMTELREWLQAQQEWVQDGEPRAFFYNDPGVPRDRRWIEVQVPVKRSHEHSS